ncbi:MAG: winged helix DNA-binding protein [Candidatus Aenigmarchaeota archaeon]|nr:winged helix DNA-binding protein [Candidatus Aenigmarchaeota archaeon]
MLSEKKKLMQIFFRVKPAELLLSLREGPKYAAIISKETDCTYSHTIKLLETFNKLGLLTFEKTGRKKIVRLTSTGQTIANAIYSILMKLPRVKEGKT